MDNSRASSVEHEVGSLNLTESSKKSPSEDEDMDSNDPSDMIRPKIRRGGRKARILPKKMTVKLGKQNSLEDGDLPDSNSSTPPLDGSRPVRAAVANANAISGTFFVYKICLHFVDFVLGSRSAK